MMTREEVAEIMVFCKDAGISYKSRLHELGIPEWKFYASKSRYARQEEANEESGAFLQLGAGDSFAPAPSFAATAGRKPRSKRDIQPSKMLHIELRTPNGTIMRIQGEMSPEFIQSIVAHV